MVYTCLSAKREKILRCCSIPSWHGSHFRWAEARCAAEVFVFQFFERKSFAVLPRDNSSSRRLHWLTTYGMV
jgi:hypothetical protein